jgi:TPR repeat protein
MHQYKKIITEARKAYDEGDAERLRKLINPLVKRGNAEAIAMRGSYSDPYESTFKFERRYLRSLVIAANKGHPSSIYRLGACYDLGEQFDTFRFPLDQGKAAKLFKKSANLDHAHSQWIHAIDLLYGTPYVEKNVDEGLRYLALSRNAKFVAAFETMAEFHEKGEFGFIKDENIANKYQKLASC